MNSLESGFFNNIKLPGCFDNILVKIFVSLKGAPRAMPDDTCKKLNKQKVSFSGLCCFKKSSFILLQSDFSNSTRIKKNSKFAQNFLQENIFSYQYVFSDATHHKKSSKFSLIQAICFKKISFFRHENVVFLRRDTPHHLKNKRVSQGVDKERVATIIAQVCIADCPAMSFIFVYKNPNVNKLSWAINYRSVQHM